MQHVIIVCNHLSILTITRTYPSQGKPFLSTALIVSNLYRQVDRSGCRNILVVGATANTATVSN